MIFHVVKSAVLKNKIKAWKQIMCHARRAGNNEERGDLKSNTQKGIKRTS
jgi:hypothetical protein